MPIGNISFNGTINRPKKQINKKKIAIVTASLIAGGVAAYAIVKKKPDSAISKGIKSIINYIKKSSILAGLLGFIGGIFGYNKVSKEEDAENKTNKPAPIIIVQNFNTDNNDSDDNFSTSSSNDIADIIPEEPEIIKEESKADVPFVLMDDKTPEVIPEEEETKPRGSEIEIIPVTDEFLASRKGKKSTNTLDAKENDGEHASLDKIFALFKSQSTTKTSINVQDDDSKDNLAQNQNAQSTSNTPFYYSSADEPESKKSEKDFNMDIQVEEPKKEPLPDFYFEPTPKETKPNFSGPDFILDIPSEEPKKEPLPSWYFEPLTPKEPKAKSSGPDFYFEKPTADTEKQPVKNSDDTDEENSTDAFDKLIQASAQPPLPKKSQAELFIDLSTLPPFNALSANAAATGEVGAVILNNAQKYRTQKRLSMKNILALINEQLGK